MTGQRIRPVLLMVILFGVVTIVFLPAVGNDFVDWDDYAFVTMNPHIRSLSPSSVARLFTETYQGIWLPLTWLSHAVDKAVWGNQPSPHHLMSILIHAGNTVLAFLVFLKLLEIGGLDERRRFPAALLAALFFGIHPLRVEPVVWISSRKDLLLGFFYLASIFAYLGYAVRSGTVEAGRCYGAALVLCVLALLSKPMAMTLPAVLLILDYYPLKRITRSSAIRIIAEKIPFAAFAVFAALMNVYAARVGAVPFSYVPPYMRIMNAFHGLVFYIEKTLWPADLLPIYQLDRTANYFGIAYIAAAILVIVITAAVVYAALRGRRLWSAVWFFYLVTIAPALGLFMSFRHAAADRYTYLPTLGFWLLGGLGIVYLWYRVTDTRFRTAVRVILVLFVIAAAGACIALTRSQITVWKDSKTLWTYLINNADHIPALAYFGLGKELEKEKELDRALQMFKTAYAINPKHNVYLSRIGRILAKQGNTEEARRIFERIIEKEPENPRFHYYLGRLHGVDKRYDEARESFEYALKLDPDFHQAVAMLMLLHIKTGDREQAERYFREYRSRGFTVSPEILEELEQESLTVAPPSPTDRP